jgi:hypothetical protein
MFSSKLVTKVRAPMVSPGCTLCTKDTCTCKRGNREKKGEGERWKREERMSEMRGKKGKRS